MTVQELMMQLQGIPMNATIECKDGFTALKIDYQGYVAGDDGQQKLEKQRKIIIIS